MPTEMEHSTAFEQQLQRVASDVFRRPNLQFLESTQEAKEGYLKLCVPLHKAALKGDWKQAKKILESDWTLLTAAITIEWATVLHVAAGANHVHFVDELLKLLPYDALELQDCKGNTAFWYAAAGGNVQIAENMTLRHASLPMLRCGGGVIPLHVAVLQGRSEMAEYLFLRSLEILEEMEWIQLFFICINSRLYDLALKMLKFKDSLAIARDENDETGLHILARKASLCGCQSLRSRKHLMRLCKKDTTMVELILCTWGIFLTLDNWDIPSQVIFIAAEVGNFEFISMAVSTFPALISELDNMGRSIIHAAVLSRDASIFSLIHEVGPIKNFVVTFIDDEGNNLLHCAAKLASQNRLNYLVPGAALQMVLELAWFEEVKKITLPSYMEMKNSAGFTPRQLFTKEHEELLKKGESWLKETANSCMVVSTLIATGVFSAAFSLPGGNNDSTGTPNYLEKPAFLIFALSDAMALMSSSTSILIFLSILISRYAEEDFLKSLPLKLIFGLVALFLSIISMMLAFSSAFFITYYHGLKWVPNFISALAFAPVPLFVCLQFPLWYDIVYSAYICSSLSFL